MQRHLGLEGVGRVDPLSLGDLGGGVPGPLLEDDVAVDERAPEALGHAAPHGGLARAHQAEEHDVPRSHGGAYQ
ncbi:MAG TPA: hypothetical protein VFV32_05050 [Acidimicrobiales bacterium]|nr:hypothetical protein [Acidimicrobiales bacterium]